MDGVLWEISSKDEKHLDFYEGFPRLYGKEPVKVTDKDGNTFTVMAYTMNAPYRNTPALPSWEYLNGIVTGCQQHDLDPWPVLEAVQVLREARRKIPVRKKQDRER